MRRTLKAFRVLTYILTRALPAGCVLFTSALAESNSPAYGRVNIYVSAYAAAALLAERPLRLLLLRQQLRFVSRLERAVLRRGVAPFSAATVRPSLTRLGFSSKEQVDLLEWMEDHQDKAVKMLGRFN
jgi:hypothetical protein